jgi:hypothetical protein
LTLIVNQYAPKKVSIHERIETKNEFTMLEMTRFDYRYLLIVSVVPETAVVYTCRGCVAGPCSAFPAVSKIELWQVQVKRLLEKAQLSKQPECVHTEVKATKVPLILATRVLAESINNQPPVAASFV